MDSLDKRPKRKKMDMRFGTWNVTSIYRAGSLRAVVEEITKYKLDLVGVQEITWGERAQNQQANIHFSMERGMRIMN
jgi:exonuclease III